MSRVLWFFLLLSATGPLLAAMNVIRPGDATHTVVADGAWFDPAIWQPGVPGEGAVAYVPAGRRVTYAGHGSAGLRGVLVDGRLLFSPDQSSTLRVDTIEVGMQGELLIGTVAEPVRPEVQVRIVFTSVADIDISWDPELLSRGLIAHGRVHIHGARKTVHDKVAVDPLAGQTSLVMAGPRRAGRWAIPWSSPARAIPAGNGTTASAPCATTAPRARC